MNSESDACMSDRHLRSTPVSDLYGHPHRWILISLLVLAFGLSACAHQSAAIPAAANPPSPALATVATAPPKAVEPAESQTPDSEQDNALEKDPFGDDPFADEEENDQEQSFQEVADPLSGFNRIMFQINDKLYFWVLKPVTRGYRAVTPTFFRIGIKNFFDNLLGPLRFVNCLLQGKGEAADHEAVRFVMNTTVGVLGFGNPAKNYPELASSEEDFGQTFGRWGIGDGFYIVWPVLGPSTLRDSVGMVGDWFMDPTSYVEPFEASVAIWSFHKVNTLSFHIGDYESLKEAAIDPYEAFRNAYIQYRKSQIAK
jgi:phospholipid-binding lipoprotein MlaA